VEVGGILAQNPIGEIDQLVMYSSKLFIYAKRIYIAIEKEALIMVYALHKFRHYLLCNRFKFFVDHMALVYLVNKPQVSVRLTKWLLFLDYDFKKVYKLGRAHLTADALSRLPNHTEPMGIHDQTCDAHLFTQQPKWSQSVYGYLLEGVMLARLTTSQRQYLAQRTKPFVFKGVLYIFRQDNRFH
jgi:hypothetical protein